MNQTPDFQSSENNVFCNHANAVDRAPPTRFVIRRNPMETLLRRSYNRANVPDVGRERRATAGAASGDLREGVEVMSDAIGAMRQHQLIILQQLVRGPLTEFELAQAVAQATGFEAEIATEMLPQWLDELRGEGLVWSGMLYNSDQQSIAAAALTNRGRDLVM